MPFEDKSKKNSEDRNRKNNQGMSGFQVPSFSPELVKALRMIRMNSDFSRDNPNPVQNERTIDLTEEENINFLKEISKALEEEPASNKEAANVGPEETADLLAELDKVLKKSPENKLEKKLERLRGYNKIDNAVKKAWNEYVDINFRGVAQKRRRQSVGRFFDYIKGKTSQPTKDTVLAYFRQKLDERLFTSTYLEQELNVIQRFFDFTEGNGIYRNVGKELSYNDIGDLYQEKIGCRWH